MEYPVTNAKECSQNGYLLLKGRCYAPALDPDRKPVPTSSPAEFQKAPKP